MREQLTLQKLLTSKYEELRTRNPSYSRRAFARKLGLSAGAMSEFFNGHRLASRQLAEKISERLLLDPQERAELFRSFDEKENKSDQVGSDYLKLSADQFRIIGDWYHFAILTLMRTRGFKSDPKWIALRLGLPITTITQALERLKRLELIQESPEGKLTRSESGVRTSDDVANVSVKRAHLQYLDKAKETLDSVPVELRDFTSMMMSIDPERLPRLKERIRAFQDSLAEEFDSEPQSEAYQLCVQLFPLTQVNPVTKPVTKKEK